MSEEPASYMTPTAEAIALRQDLARAIARAEKAEARVKEQQAELAEQEQQVWRLARATAAHKNNGRFPLCPICENGPALCECPPLPKKKL